jgi:hypothetical protein
MIVVSLHRRSPSQRAAHALLLALLAVLALASAARADAVTIDFESGPPVGTAVNDDYLASAFTRFQLADAGFRPYRKTVAASLAHSGTTVANVGPDLCGPAEGVQGADCEFVEGATTGRFTHTASKVTLYAGQFTNDGSSTHAQLKAFRANGTLITTSPMTLIGVGFHTPVTVASAANDIARFELGFDTGALVGFDDLTVDFPAGTVADVSLSGPINPTTILQGTTTDVPITLTRLNGSNGPLTLSASGLPAGVSASFTPNPLPGTQDSAVMHLLATDTAPAFFQPQDVTVKAESIPPDANILPEPRTLAVPVTVRTQFDLSQATPGLVALPQCAPVDVGLRVQRDFAFALANKTVSLSVGQLPPGVTAEFLPSATVAPGGGLIAEPTLRLRRGTGFVPPGYVTTLTATAPNAPARTIPLTLGTAPSTATLDSTTLSGAVPGRLQPGSQIRLTGNGFCVGTKVRVGNDLAETDTTIEPSETGLTFRLPRLATTGTVTIVPPGGAPAYAATNTITVRSTRNTSGFQFNNPGWGNLSFDEITSLVGTEEMFLSTNPCWPFGDCTIALPIPDPIAYAKWQIIEQVVQESGGHCFGISRFLQEIGDGRIHNSQFAPGVTTTFGLPARSGPNDALSHYLDARHAGQATKEFLLTYGLRNDSIAAQLNRLHSELAAGRLASLMIKNGFTQGHVITAYDMETKPDGSTVIYTYDNETEFTPEEESDTTGATHRDRENASQVIVNPAKTRWDYTGGGWHGGNDGSFYISLLSDWPGGTAPTLPGVLDAIIGIFGSDGGAAATGPEPKGAQIMPVLDRNAIPGAAGFVIGDPKTKTVTHVMEGKKDGTYDQMLMGGGFIGGVQDVPTAKGVTDRLTGTPGDDTITFAGEKTRPLQMQVGSEGKSSSRLATISTHTSAGGDDTAALPGASSLVYEHDGPQTTFSFDLTSVEKGASAAHFASGPLTIHRGDRVVVKPADWRRLDTVRMTVRRANGTRTTRAIRDRTASPVRITVAKPQLRKAAGGRRVARVTMRLRGVGADSVLGVTLRLVRRGHTVARKGFAVKQPANASRTFSWPIPKGTRHGAYRLVADVLVASTGARPATRRASRHAAVRIR